MQNDTTRRLEDNHDMPDIEVSKWYVLSIRYLLLATCFWAALNPEPRLLAD